MKVAHAEKHVLGSHGLSETKTFQIRTNAHAFKLLSSGLYSDKVAAVLREIGCNAADAHIEYGTPDVPFIVKLPNRIDNQFYIRDMGPGLSHEDVLNLYTTYFASTKQNSNDFTGAFGLGSKSPFSYTDSFSVVSVHNGVKRTYSAYIDNTGSPTISKLTEGKPDDDWQHGVQIGFPVKPEDFTIFRDRAERVYGWFRITPTILGSQPITKFAPTYVDPNGEFTIHGDHRDMQLSVVMGNVMYPVSTQKLNLQGYRGYRHHSSPQVDESPADFINAFPHVVLHLNIGDIQIAASREEPQYDKDTIAFLKAKLDKVVSIIANKVAEDLRTADTWAKKCAAHTLVGKWGTNMHYTTDWTHIFRACDIKDYAQLGSLAAAYRYNLPDWVGNDTSKVRFVLPDNTKRGYYTNQIYEGHITTVDKTGKLNKYSDASIPLEARMGIYWVDDHSPFVRLKGQFSAGVVRQAFIVEPEKGKTVLDAQLHAEKIAKHLGTKAEAISTIALPADYTPPVRKKYKKKGATLPPLPNDKVKCYTLTNGATEVQLSSLKPDSLNFMVLSPHTGWGKQNQIRVYESTAEKDLMLEEREWKRIWDNVSKLAKVVKPEFTGYIMASALEVKRWDLVKRGYKPMHTVIKEWLAKPEVLKALQDHYKKWKPTIDLNDTPRNWASAMIRSVELQPEVWKAIKQYLDKKDADFISDTYALSKREGHRASEPVAITVFRNLSSEFHITIPHDALKGDFISIDQFDSHLEKRYPVMEILDGEVIKGLANASKSVIEKFAKFVTTT